MSAETLRRAASLMREAGAPQQKDEFGLAVADWLSSTADYIELAVDGRNPGWKAAQFHALAVANAYLQETP